MFFFPVDMHDFFSSGNLPRKKHIIGQKKRILIFVFPFFLGGGYFSTEKVLKLFFPGQKKVLK